MTKKVIITFIIITSLVIGAFYFLPNNKQVDSQSISKADLALFELPSLEEENLSELELDDEIELKEKLVEIPKKIIEQKSDTSLSIYVEADIDELLKKVPTKKSISPILGIQIEPNSISKLNVGDTIKLPSLGQIEYEAKITKKITHKNGSTSVTGNLVGDQNAKFSVVLTEGKTSSYASITTPEGAYEIETINGIGYVYSVQDIENKYIDPTKDDFLLPPGSVHIEEH